jgi:hypothetical protein
VHVEEDVFAALLDDDRKMRRVQRAAGSGDRAAENRSRA